MVGMSMPTAPASPVRTGRRITDVVGRFFAGAIDVCRDGDRVALHLSTGQGEIVVTLPTKEFVLKCRGSRDHNLNPLPNPADFVKAELPEHREVRPTVSSPIYQQAFEMLMKRPEMTQREAAEMVGVKRCCLSAWMTKVHPGALRARREALGIPQRGRCPNPVNHAQAAAQGAPLTKPSGRVL